MQTDTPQPSCITLRYGQKRYLLCADEVTNFLINCDDMGLKTIPDITNEIEKIIIIIAKLSPHETDPVSIKLLKEIVDSMQGAIFIDQ